MKNVLLAIVFLACGWLIWNRQPAPEVVPVDLKPTTPVVTQVDLNADVASSAVAASSSSQHGEAVDASSGNSARTGILALDEWHRLGQSNWSSTGDSAIAQALKDFSQLWSSNSSIYQTLLRESVPTSLGGDFATLATAFATGGNQGLADSLNSAPHITPAWLAWADALSFQYFAGRDFQNSSAWTGRTVREMMDAGYPRERVLGFADSAMEFRGYARDFLPYEEYVVQGGDSLNLICRNYRKQGWLLSYGWVNAFNGKGVFNTNLRLAQKLKLPKDPLHLEAWRGQRLLMLYAGENTLVGIYEASFGKDGNATPLGEFTLGDFLREPVFWQQGADPVPFGNPENPLGTRWMGFAENPSYGIHGNTNAADTIGSFESLGCIRMHNSEVEELFELMPRGGRVVVKD